MTPIRFTLLGLLALSCTGCLNPGHTIRVKGEIVDVSGDRVPDAKLLAISSKRGGLIMMPSEEAGPASVDQGHAHVEQYPDGTFYVRARWSGTLAISVDGYKIRRVDDLGTEFLVPSQNFYESQDQVTLEVVKHD